MKNINDFYWKKSDDYCYFLADLKSNEVHHPLRQYPARIDYIGGEWQVHFSDEFNYMYDENICKRFYSVNEFKIEKVQDIVLKSMIRVLKIKAFL